MAAAGPEAVQGISAAAPAAAGPRAGGCAWGWARVLVRVLVDPDGVLVKGIKKAHRVNGVLFLSNRNKTKISFNCSPTLRL